MKKSTIMIGAVAAAVAVGYPAYKSFFGATAVEVSEKALNTKFSEYRNSESFISAQELNALMSSDQDVVVIGALNPMRPNQPISGSFTLWRNDYSASSDAYPFGGMQNTQEEMEALLSQFGATPESTIVVYAADSHHDAARLFWQVTALGHNDVRYLDGGLNAWMGADFATGNANPSVEATEYAAPSYSDIELATLDMVIDAQTNDDWVIIDTRSLAEFDGSTTVSGAAGPGAIPGSVHIEWTETVEADSTLREKQELAALYADVIEGKKVITYCQSGVRSAHSLLVLKEILGAQEVYNYDGSWIEYSHEHYVEKNPSVNVMNGNS
ncbi:sulfurtransferase [Vibrio astriarenae]|uniref:Sulfurtransferase n=1 Tax=Vibrio astriarenae TaxID=1481923 RepID=A0A7Z2T1J7_9VIBR|nr:rhodanese-like domain-containing protein [Vibrio astriarenae]QIA62591.1 sulfurtransferase [Vibrio astriarenae]